MKKINIALTAASLLVLTVLAAACSDSREPEAGLAPVATPESAMRIEIVDGGFLRAADDSPLANSRMTRALPDTVDSDDNWYRATVFEMGDSVGIYALDKTGKVVVSNAKFTCGGRLWGTDTPLAYKSDYEYFCYFPYRPDSLLEHAPQVDDQMETGLTAEQFFASVIGDWTVKVDQSDYHDYQLSDLMVGKGEPSDDPDYVMLFTLNHQFGLVILDIGQVKQILRSGNYYWFEPATDSFQGASDTTDVRIYVPTTVNGQTRCIIPVATPVKFGASDGQWQLNAIVSTSGHGNVYCIGYTDDDPKSGWSYFDLQVGDVMYDDGSLLHVTDDNEVIITQRASHAIGFVAFVNDGTSWAQKVIDDTTDDRGISNSRYSNGLVHSLTSIKNWTMQLPEGYTLDEDLRATYPSIGTAYYHYSGLRLTRNYIRIDQDYYTANEAHINNAMEPLLNKVRPTAANTPTSEWFVPALGQIAQCFYACIYAKEPENEYLTNIRNMSTLTNIPTADRGDYKSPAEGFMKYFSGSDKWGSYFVPYIECHYFRPSVGGASSLYSSYHDGQTNYYDTHARYQTITPYSIENGRPLYFINYGRGYGDSRINTVYDYDNVSGNFSAYAFFPYLAF